MGRFKDMLFTFGSKSKKSRQPDDQRITFYVPDHESRTSATKALSKIRIPVAPQLRTLESAYVFGDSLLQRLRKDKIQIVEQKGLSKEEAYKVNEKTLKGLVEQRNDLADTIEKILHPVIRVVAGHTVQVDELYGLFLNAERRIRELETMMQGVNGVAPVVPALPNGKQLWTGNVKSAALKVIQDYDLDNGASMPSFRSLRDASDQFFDAYEFRDKSKYTKEGFYSSVKKANMPWGKTVTKRE